MTLRIGDTATFEEIPELAIARDETTGRKIQKVDGKAWEVCARGLMMVRSGPVVSDIAEKTRLRLVTVFENPFVLENVDRAERHDGTWWIAGAIQ